MIAISNWKMCFQDGSMCNLLLMKGVHWLAGSNFDERNTLVESSSDGSNDLVGWSTPSFDEKGAVIGHL